MHTVPNRDFGLNSRCFVSCFGDLIAEQSAFYRVDGGAESIHERISIDDLHASKKDFSFVDKVYHAASFHASGNVTPDRVVQAQSAQEQHNVAEGNQQLNLSFGNGLEVLSAACTKAPRKLTHLISLVNMLLEEVDKNVHLASSSSPTLEHLHPTM